MKKIPDFGKQIKIIAEFNQLQNKLKKYWKTWTKKWLFKTN